MASAAPNDPPLVVADEAGLRRAAALIRAGEVIAFPTETLYGLAALPSPDPLEKLCRIKQRPPGQALPLLVADLSALEGLVSVISPLARVLMARHWPGALTLVLPARPGLPEAIVGPGQGVGVRLSSDPVASALVRSSGGVLTCTSANQAGLPPATTAAQARLPGLALVLDDGNRCAPASTVVELLGRPRILRQGSVEVDLS